MNAVKSLAYAVFFVFLCISPIIVFAQDGSVGRLIDVPNVENDNSSLTMTTTLRDALSNAGHIVYSESEMIADAESKGQPSNYWDSPESIAKANEKLRRDALVKFVYQKGKKPSMLVIVHNSYTGEVLAELERSLKKKKLTKDDTKAIVRGVNMVMQDIVPIEYSDEIVIRITSTPAGATVKRGMEVLGTTPLEYKMDPRTGVSEQWVISYPEREDVSQLIYLDKDGSYDVALTAPAKDKTRRGKVAGGTGRPIFLVGFNISPTIKSLDSEADTGRPIQYTSQAFPVFSFDVDFFPFALMLDNQYLAGLGLQLGIGFGFLDTLLKYAEVEDSGYKCKSTGNGQFTCETSYIRFNLDLVYRLMLQKKGERLNGDGMALDFLLGFNLAKYTLQNNPNYLGHDYSGFKLGVRFSTPLGLRQLRLDTGLALIINAGQGDLAKLAKWGSLIEKSVGVNWSIHMLYDIWKGIYVRAGYSLSYMNDDFGGVGCLDSNCLTPRNATSEDLYHEIQLGFGYMLY